jgi:riboflavin biosynthesis RibT protein
MLLRYKKAFEKIAMGLLSFMPQEKDVKKLIETIHQYEKDSNWQLYLWKKEEDLVGIIGIQVFGEEAFIHHISVSPSHRGEGIGTEMVQKLSSSLGTISLKPTADIKLFFEKCKIEKEEE